MTKRNGSDWKALLITAQATFDWMFDIAADRAAGSDQQVHAITATRLFLRAWLGGYAAQVRVDDLIATAATVFAELELDMGIDSFALLQLFVDANVSVIRIPGTGDDAAATMRMSAVAIDAYVKYSATAA